VTTREFINKTIGTESPKTRSCSRVFTDERGTVYSYGYHYPLARIIDGIGFINDRGYSSTTARHIYWADRALGEKIGYANVYRIPLTNGNSLTLFGMKESAEREIDRLNDLLVSKKRTNTWVYENLTISRDNTLKALQAVEELISGKVLI